jgi:ketosteroid isomerase-like protein
MARDNTQSVEAYFDALRDHDINAMATLLRDDVREVIPLAASGAPDPWFEFQGKHDVLAYVSTIFTNFTRVEIRDREVSVTDDGRTIFVEARGDLLVAATGDPYRNVYIFRFSFDAEGLITEVREYANPVPIAPILGIPVG